MLAELWTPTDGDIVLINRGAPIEEIAVDTAYRQCRVSYTPFLDDFIARKGEEDVDRDALLRTPSRRPATSSRKA